MIRIIAGEYRHRQIKDPSREKTRPTQDRIREALFSALKSEISDRTVLDLFAGSGALAFEALSRGAKSAVMVDVSPVCLKAMRETADSLDLGERAVLIKSDALDYLKRTDRKFGLVFLDPPYQSSYNRQCIDLLQSLSLLTDDAIIVIEQDREVGPVAGFALKSYSYGSKRIGIYRRELQ